MMLPEPDEAAPGPIPTPPPILAEPVAAEPAYQAMEPPHDAIPLPPVTLAVVPTATPSVLLPATPAGMLPETPAGVPPAPGSLPVFVAPAAAAAAASSVGALMRTLASERTTAISRQGPTIEDLVREEMRPLIKAWLDTHLPPLVERLVRAEIERVVSRGA